MSRVAVIGDRDSVLGFKALGVSIFSASNADEAADSLRWISGEDYAVCFITEEFARELEALINTFRKAPSPIVVPIPSRLGSIGFGMERLKVNMRKATGADVLFEKRGQ